MIALDFEVKLTGESALSQLAAAMGKDLATVVRERAPAMAASLARYTMPVADADTGGGIDLNTVNFTGDGKVARDLGRAAVRRDIRRVYMVPSEAFAAISARQGDAAARAFSRLMKQGQYQQAQAAFQKATGRILNVVPFDGGNLHQQFRNNRGRVSRKSPLVIVQDPAALKAYIAQVENLVGWAKSGWVMAGRSVQGGRGGRVPAWMQLPAPGHATFTQRDGSFSLQLHNDVPYADSALSNRYYVRALEAFDARLAKEAKHIVRAHLTKPKPI